MMNLCCFIKVSSLFSMFFTLKPTKIHLLNINDSSMKHRWITNEAIMCHCWRNSYFISFTVEIKLKNLWTFHIKPSFPITLSEKFCQKFELKGKRTITWTLTEKNLTAISKLDYCLHRIYFWAKFFITSFFSDFNQKSFNCCSQNWILRVKRAILRQEVANYNCIKKFFFGLPTKNFRLNFSTLISTCLNEQFG